ncbi:MAG TPA: ABC transporter permease [Thermoanaerobaculia bacterium]|jgi:predicted permease
MASWRRAFRLHLKGGTVEQDVDDEIAFHVETRTRELIEEGMAPSAAREEALRLFGDAQRVRRACVEIGRRREKGRRRTEILAEMRQDAAFALRQLRKAPAFTLVAVLALALGIGATAALFSVLYAVVLRPLPFDHPERVVVLLALNPERETRSLSPGSFLEFRRRMRSVGSLAASFNSSFNLTGEGPPERIEGALVSAGWFEAFGARPVLGRVFSADEDRPGRDRVAVLSHRLWRGRFGADPEVVGRTVRLNGLPHTVLGIMPASFDLRSDSPRLWVPLALGPEERTNFGNKFLRVVGRLRPGVSVPAAQGEAETVARQIVELDPRFNTGLGARIEPYVDRLLGGYRKRLWVLLGAVGCVLLIACVNVANLLLARGAARSREIALRAALGAGRGRIVRQLLTESLMLALIGAAGGLGLAHLGVRSLVAASPPGMPRLEQAGIDGPVLAFTLGLSLLSSLLCGLVPALKTARPDLQSMLKEGGASLGFRPRDRVRVALLVTEVALALVLLVGAGLLIRSALRLQRVEIGFDPERLLTAQLSFPQADYPGADGPVDAVGRMVEEMERLPGVTAAAAVTILPLSSSTISSEVRFDGRPPQPGKDPSADTRAVTPGFFGTLGIPVLAGREFTGDDRRGAPGVVAVNQTLARLAWPGQSPLGRRLDYTGEWLEVVAVVGDVRSGLLDEDLRPAFYVPLAQYPPELWKADVQLALAVRTQDEPASLVRDLRRIVHAVDPRLPLFSVATMDEIRASSVASTRLNTLLLTLLGTIGLILAAVGIYGVVAYFVSQRTQEIGVRMALGATEGRVLALVVEQALRPLALGLALGLAGALAASRLLSGFLFEVSATDPVTFAGVLVVLAAAALLASWLPAKRAARVDPTRALAP